MLSKPLMFCALALLLGHVAESEGQPGHAGGAASGAVRVTFPPGKTVVELPMLGTSERPLVEVSVNGSEPAPFALDTGSVHSLWLGGPMPGVTRSAIVMHMGGLEIEGAGLQAVDATQLGELPFKGILGTAAFSSLVVELDWQQRVVRLHEPSGFEAPPGVTPVEVDTSDGYVIARGTVRVGEARTEVGLFVDTGAGYALTLREGRIAPPAKMIPHAPIGKGMHGIISASVGRVDSLEFGDAVLNGVVTNFVAPDTMITPPQYEAGIGFEVLKRFVVYFDLSHGQVWLAATDEVAEPFEFTTSGLKLLPGVNADGAAEVLGVVAGSPAANAGIQAGDFILAANARPVAELGIEGLEAIIQGEPGEEVALEVRRSTATRTVRLRLENLL